MDAGRRRFVAGAAASLAWRRGRGQFAVGGGSQTTRLDLATIDRSRIIAGATVALAREPEPTPDAGSDAFLQMTMDLPALGAAAQVDVENETRYGVKAAATLERWFGDGGPNSPFRVEISGFEDLLQLSGLAEVAVSLVFLPVEAVKLAGAKLWFRRYLNYLATDTTAGLARDAKDRHASSWLLQVAAYSKLLGDDAKGQAARVRFRHAALRALINGEGFFAGELRTTDPFRNSLMSLDMLGGVCTLLSTRFESMWDAELQDGPGMRAAVARHMPYMARPETWPYPADETHFSDLPGRRPVLAFAARAYSQPEYASIFLKLKETTDPVLLRAMPIRQPLLWVAQPRRRG